MSYMQQTEKHEMSLYVCINCPLTRTDLGEWDSEHSFFKNILQVHKYHEGFKKGIIKHRETIEDITSNFMIKNYHRMLHIVINSFKGQTKNCLLRGVLDEI